MIYAKYNKRDDYLIPSQVILGDNITPVWIQQRWTDGEFSEYIVRNGCGHCCTAMTANLKGIKITPYEEYELCRKLWGAPNAGEQQDHFLSIDGKILVANSSEKTTNLGVHLVDEEVITQSIYAPTYPEEFTWGVGAKLPKVAGYVIVD